MTIRESVFYVSKKYNIPASQLTSFFNISRAETIMEFPPSFIDPFTFSELKRMFFQKQHIVIVLGVYFPFQHDKMSSEELQAEFEEGKNKFHFNYYLRHFKEPSTYAFYVLHA